MEYISPLSMTHVLLLSRRSLSVAHSGTTSVSCVGAPCPYMAISPNKERVWATSLSAAVPSFSLSTFTGRVHLREPTLPNNIHSNPNPSPSNTTFSIKMDDRMDYETYETDQVYDSMERNLGVDEVCDVWIKIIIVEFVIHLMQSLYSIKGPQDKSPTDREWR